MSPAATARVEAAAPRAAAARRPQRRERKKPRVTGGIVWIAVVAALMAGVVAMNVAVLRLNMTSDKLTRERASLLAKNAELRSQLSSAAATAHIEILAHKQLGLVPADPAKTVYINLGK